MWTDAFFTFYVSMAGVVTSLGNEVRSVWQKVLAGECGISKITDPGNWFWKLQYKCTNILIPTVICIRLKWWVKL